MEIGYARVSTDGQTLDAQLEALAAAGVGKVFQEKISGARADRPQFAKLLAVVAPGDVVVVTRLDRLARSTRDLLNLLGEITAKGAAFRSLADHWADTTTPHGRLNRPTHPPLRDRRNRKRKLALQEPRLNPDQPCGRDHPGRATPTSPAGVIKPSVRKSEGSRLHADPRSRSSAV